jgi:integrase
MPGKKVMLLTDAAVTALSTGSVVWDSRVQGLYVRRGIKRVTWTFMAERRRHGKRVTICKRLGHHPGMSVAAARREAASVAGKLAEGLVPVGRRSETRFGEALAVYLDYLRAKAERAGKPARWAANVDALARTVLDEWKAWPLSDLSASPGLVRDWHQRMTSERGPVSANHSAKIMRATYRYAAKLNRDLPAALPTSAVSFNREEPSQEVVSNLPAWWEQWQGMTDPVHQAFHLCNLLTGTRPGELARVRWTDVRPRRRTLVIAHAKAGYDIEIPLSWPIAACLKAARRHGKAGQPLVFGDCAASRKHDKLKPAGMALRHTYRTVCIELGIDELITHFLMGHRPAGISQRYIARMILTSGGTMRKAQREVSARMMKLSGEWWWKIMALSTGRENWLVEQYERWDTDVAVKLG